MQPARCGRDRIVGNKGLVLEAGQKRIAQDLDAVPVHRIWAAAADPCWPAARPCDLVFWRRLQTPLKTPIGPRVCHTPVTNRLVQMGVSAFHHLNDVPPFPLAPVIRHPQSQCCYWQSSPGPTT